MRTTAAMLLVIVLSTVSSCSGQGLAIPSDEEWTRIQDDTSGISVELPGTPETQTLDLPDQEGGTFPARTWLVNVDNNRASIGFSVADVQGRAIDLPGALEGMATSLNGTILEQSETAQSGHIDSVIAVTQNDTEGRVHARVVDGGDSMVILQSVGGLDDDQTLADVQQRLADSLVMP